MRHRLSWKATASISMAIAIILLVMAAPTGATSTNQLLAQDYYEGYQGAGSLQLPEQAEPVDLALNDADNLLVLDAAVGGWHVLSKEGGLLETVRLLEENSPLQVRAFWHTPEGAVYVVTDPDQRVLRWRSDSVLPPLPSPKLPPDFDYQPRDIIVPQNRDLVVLSRGRVIILTIDGRYNKTLPGGGFTSLYLCPGSGLILAGKSNGQIVKYQSYGTHFRNMLPTEPLLGRRLPIRTVAADQLELITALQGDLLVQTTREGQPAFLWPLVEDESSQTAPAVPQQTSMVVDSQGRAFLLASDGRILVYSPTAFGETVRRALAVDRTEASAEEKAAMWESIVEKHPEYDLARRHLVRHLEELERWQEAVNHYRILGDEAKYREAVKQWRAETNQPPWSFYAALVLGALLLLSRASFWDRILEKQQENKIVSFLQESLRALVRPWHLGARSAPAGVGGTAVLLAATFLGLLQYKVVNPFGPYQGSLSAAAVVQTLLQVFLPFGIYVLGVWVGVRHWKQERTLEHIVSTAGYPLVPLVLLLPLLARFDPWMTDRELFVFRPALGAWTLLLFGYHFGNLVSFDNLGLMLVILAGIVGIGFLITLLLAFLL